MYRVEAVEKVPAETDLSEAEGDVDNATDENMDNLDNEEDNLKEKHSPNQSNEHYKSSVRHFSLAHKVRILQRRTRSCDGAEGDDSWQTQVLVTHQQAEDEGHEEGGDGAVGVGLGPVEHQYQLGEEDDVGEVTTENTGIDEIIIN